MTTQLTLTRDKAGPLMDLMKEFPMFNLTTARDFTSLPEDSLLELIRDFVACDLLWPGLSESGEKMWERM